MTSDTAAIITELEDRRFAAVEQGDYGAFAALAHPDLVYAHSSGVVDTLDSYLAKCDSGFYVYHRVEHPIDRIVVAPGTVVVVGEMHADITAGGVSKHLANCSVAVWTQTEDGWRLLSFQGTPLPASAPAQPQAAATSAVSQ
ncbi:nuclear transport factor 2 family protein [Pseudonocardia kujensis]|uniref:nuclear transport factor 2 family protein n=1 Tax=Pseudonocardia kujensis TaxID=1128675 RepID=UPI001E544156|nr:nuclear transport factor 2 family protein [Pseudonocardia kujensis]MCE0764918.1 nuclear transport factor 2 family protein [Pseudonocardia kujensis]